MKVAALQLTALPDPQANRDKLAQYIREAASQGAELVVLQELHNSPYFCCELAQEHFDLAEPIPGPSTEQFGRLAQELGIVVVASLFERRTGGIYHNTAVVLDKDGSIAGLFRKMHIPHDPGFEEKYYFTPGDAQEDGFTPIQTSIGKLGVLVCWDQWYPEAARIMALNGADILIYPTAIGWDPDDTADEQQRQRDAWITIQRAHAIANGLPLISCNRVGFEKGAKMTTAGSQFWGSSFVTDSMGKITAQADTESETVLLSEVDFGESESTRRTWPFLRDRRIDAYDDITKRFK